MIEYHMNEWELARKIQTTGILPVICPANQAELDTLIDALRGTDISVIEITLRNDFATRAIKYIKENCPWLMVGAGTINTPAKLEAAISCNADFFVAPGFAEFAHRYVSNHGMIFLHGVSTPSEILKLVNMGYRIMKFFPAEISGGVQALKLYSSAFEGISFVPTGGITVDNLPQYLACKNVVGCGGSFMVPKPLLAKGATEEIHTLIKKLCKKGDQQ